MINPVISLQKEIEKLQVIVLKNKVHYTNEEITKQTIILPFIKILGYDPQNPAEVKSEFTPPNSPNNSKVDYCINISGNDCIFIEAKTYGRNIDRYISQIKGYHDDSDEVEYSILTNGTDYYFFTNSKNSDTMSSSPFFCFNLLDYSIDDLETLVAFTRQKYNYREIRILSSENRIINKMVNNLYDLLGNPDALLEFLSDSNSELPPDTVNRLISVAMEKAVILKGDEYEIERKQKVILRYSEEQLLNLGKFVYIDELGHDIFVASQQKFIDLSKVDEKYYSVERGNPLSDFFIAGVYANGKNVQGYLIGHLMGTVDSNGEEDIVLYCAPWNKIEDFVKNNPIVNENGFINAKFLKRINNKTNKVSYYLQSNISGVSFQNFPNLFIEMSNFEEFYEEFFSHQ